MPYYPDNYPEPVVLSKREAYADQCERWMIIIFPRCCFSEMIWLFLTDNDSDHKEYAFFTI